MTDTILLGRDKDIFSVSQDMWKQHLAQTSQHGQARLSFMTEAHHQVRYFVVREMVNTQKAIDPEFISDKLQMPLEQVNLILDELERKLFFLVRNEHKAVSWAYPFTVEATPHKLLFNTGERLYGAGAEDAIAAPFVQGQLKQEYLSVLIETKCRHCGQALHVDLDSKMKVAVRERKAEPLVFMPDINWNTFTEPNITHAYGANTIFFWSEEHAREYRKNTQQVNGIYLTLEQCAYMTPITQGTLFAFK